MPWENSLSYGSFKKILIPSLELKGESERLQDAISQLELRFKNKTLSGVDTCFEFILLFLESRLGNRAFLKTGRPLPERENILGFLESVRFFGMPDTVRQALYHWKRDEWQIQLVSYHPTGKEMLLAQSHGYRLTTIDWEAAKSGDLIEEKRDAFEHLLHDLAHAFMFFREDYDYPGQVDFFKNMYLELDQFEPFLQSNDSFRKKFEYCISDMNSHPAHLKSYWTAIKREAGILTN